MRKVQETFCQIISIHALRGEGDVIKYCHKSPLIKISIHALRGEGDGTRFINKYNRMYFNPRPPWGGRLHKSQKKNQQQ